MPISVFSIMRFLILAFSSLFFLACNPQNSNSHEKVCPFQNSYDNVACGTMEVPENWEDPDKGSISITYAIIKSDSKKYEDPVVYLMGGPGGSAITLLPIFIDHPILANRDIILIDQRGTKYSGGVCPEIGEKVIDIISDNLTPEEEYEQLSGFAEACKNEMVKNDMDPASYNTIENAKDIIALRKHLGYKEWNLYGSSYGTRLALEIANIDPTGIRSLVLAGPISREQKFYQDYSANFIRSLNLVFENCKNDPGCNERFPDLKSLYLSLLQELSQNPLTVTVNRKDFIINSSDLALMVHQMLYNRRTIGSIPSFLTAFSEGDQDVIESGIYPLFYLSGIVDFGMYMSTQAFDEGWYDITSEFLKGEKEFPETRYGMAFHNGEIRITPSWHSERYSISYEPEKIQLPTLILAGEYDPVTPPSYGQYISEQLPDSHYYTVPGRGHALSDRCSNSVILSFLENPHKEPESICLENMPKIRFY